VPHTLLLADDNVTIQRVIELTFADEDVQVVAVSDGEQAIARMEASPPDIVLADIGMRGKNGYEVAQYVKESPRLSHIPVVLLSGAFEPVDQARASAAGCEGVLAKPFEPHLVIDRVKELLAKGTRSGAAAQPETSASGSELPSSVPPASPSRDDSWLPAPLASKPVKSAVELDHYFDELDVALSNLKTPEVGSRPEPNFAPAPESTRAAESAPAPSHGDDWFGAISAIDAPAAHDEHAAQRFTSAADGFEPSLSYGSPAADFDRPRDANPSAPQEGAARIADAPPAVAATWPPLAGQSEPDANRAGSRMSEPVDPSPASPAPPALADAFAAFLAAEDQTQARQATPLPQSGVSSPAPAIGEDVIEQIAQRVLARLSDRFVRETVADVVSSIAERLIREEIERIKAAVR